MKKLLKNIENFENKVTELRRDMLNATRQFFEANTKISIDIEKVEGCSINVRGDKDVNTIDKNGVAGMSGSFGFDELDLVDLDYIIGIINTYVNQKNG